MGSQMELNWKRGLTRLYFVFWGLWIVFIAIRVAAATPQIVFGSIPSAAIFSFIAAGLVFPAVLFLALRWAAKGFWDKDA